MSVIFLILKPRKRFENKAVDSYETETKVTLKPPLHTTPYNVLVSMIANVNDTLE